MVEITLDGTKVEVREGSMIMEAAEKLGTYIPHFCYHKKLSIAANCRMCLVDVEKAPKPMPACATPVANGMVVSTRSDKAIRAQQGVMEFLLINHPLDCPICDQGGECQLQDLAVGYGSSTSRYTEEKRVVESKDGGPLIGMFEMTRCIQCTRCVRFGVEVAGQMELGMVGRGEHSEITTFVGNAIDSELSGNMIDVCPVGALTSKPFRYSARSWELSRRKSVSPHDSLGANLIVQVKQGSVMRVLPLENEAINECWLSDRDRFGYAGLNVAERLTHPMLRQDGQWREVDWQTALEYVAHGLRDISTTHGASAIGALAAPWSTVEELHLLQKVVRGLGSDNIDTRLRQSDFPSFAGAPWLGMPIAEVSQLDRVLLIGSYLRKDQPLLSARIRQTVRAGAKLSVLHAVDDELLMPVANKLLLAPSAWAAGLMQIAAAVAREKGTEISSTVAAGVARGNEISSEASAIATSLLSGKNAAILLGSGAIQHPQYSALLELANWIAETSGARLGVLVEGANAVGAHLVRAMPAASGADASAMLGARTPRAVLLLHAEPELDSANAAAAMAALRSAEMVVAMSAYRHAADDYADVLLPIAPFSETAGSFVNAEGRLQTFNGTVQPLGETRPAWKVLRVLGNLLELSGFAHETVEAVRSEALGGAKEFAGRCANRTQPSSAPAAVAEATGLERVGEVPIYFSDAIVRRSPPLQQTRDARTPSARMNGRTLARLGLASGDRVRVVQEGPNARAEMLSELDEGVCDGVVRIAAAHPLTATLGAMFGKLTIERLGPGDAPGHAAGQVPAEGVAQA